MCRLQFYRNIQKKSTNPSIRTLVSTLQCWFLCVFQILPYTHSANFAGGFFVNICHIYENKIIDITKTQNGKGCCHFDWKH